MKLIAIVTALALIHYVFTCIAVGSARQKYGVKAPATHGPDEFERVFRVQQNTLEQLVLFLPALWLFGRYVSPLWGAAIGVIYLVGRVLYGLSYSKDPATRGLGFQLTVFPSLILLAGAIVGIALNFSKLS